MDDSLGDRDINYRLPETAIPHHYEIELAVDVEAGLFAGTETIDTVIARPTDKIVLHSVDLNVARAYACGDGGLVNAISKPDSDRQWITLSFERELSIGDWSLHLEFAGSLNRDLGGLYRSSYRDAEGKERAFAATQFEPIYARQAFPCWDEPGFKATFKLTLIIDERLTALSNAAEESMTRTAEGKRRITFRKTIKMSTYLVAFVIGDLRTTPAIDAGGVPLRIAYFGNQGHLTGWAETVAKFSLAFFAEYYEIPYPGEKLELAAVPDFAPGGMENFGLITCRENVLLIDERSASRAEREHVADVVCHEIAHMWFGDLVTMEWWDELWLNEAFATFMGVLAEDAFRPEWLSKVSFGLLRAAAMVTDGSASTRSIHASVANSSDVTNMFDVLTYQKGASILSMLEHYLGDETFREGIALYLNSHRYSNATTGDLWSALEQSSQKPVGRLMHSWIFQPGFPLVTAKLATDRRTLFLDQQPFAYETSQQNHAQRWEIPLVLRTIAEGNERVHRLILSDQAAIELPFDIQWIVVNSGGYGFYRVLYEPELLEVLLTRGLSNLGPIERFNLISDLWATTVSGSTSLACFRASASRFAGETDVNVWRSLMGSYRYVDALASEDRRDWIRKEVRELASPMLSILESLPQEQSTELQRELRGFLMAEIATLGDDPDTQRKAAALFRQFQNDRTTVAPELIPALTTIFAYCGDGDVYEHLLAAYGAAQTPQQRQRYLLALGDFQRPELLRRALEMSLSDDVRRQDAPNLLRKLLLNRQSRDDTWDFICQRWTEILKKIPDNSISRLCQGISGLVDRVEEVHAFFDEHAVPFGNRTILQHLEQLKLAAAFRQREAATVAVGMIRAA